MADELGITISVNATKNNFSFKKSWGRKTSDMASGGVGPGTVTATTSEGSLSVTGKGKVMLQNLDETNFIEWGFATGVYPCKLIPGDSPDSFRVNGTVTIYYKADTASCQLDILGFNA